MNFVLAYVAIVLFLAIYGVTLAQVPQIYGLVEGAPAQAAGIEAGDVVVAVNGEAISFDEAGLDAMTRAIEQSEGAVQIAVERDGEPMTFTVEPEAALVDGQEQRQIGVYLGREERASFGEALRARASGSPITPRSCLIRCAICSSRAKIWTRSWARWAPSPAWATRRRPMACRPFFPWSR